MIEEKHYGTVPKYTPTFTACGYHVSFNSREPPSGHFEKKDVTNEQLLSQMETIKTLIVILLRSKGL